MNMINVGEELNEESNTFVDEKAISEQKMMQLMNDMQQKAAQATPDIEVTAPPQSVAMTIKPEDNTNYWEIDDIPTKYKLYPDGTKIMARPLKVIEIKKLTSINSENADDLVNDILRKSIRGIDVNEIYSADKMYLILWLRANSFRDNKYVVTFDCEVCSKETSYHFDINNVIVNYINDDYDPNETLTLSNGDVLTFKLLQIKDELGIKSFNLKHRSTFEKTGEEVDDELLSISFMIDTINGKKENPIHLYNYLLNMDPGDFAAMTTILSNNNIGIDSNINVTCTECGGESIVGLMFHPDFFLPSNGVRRDTGDRISND